MRRSISSIQLLCAVEIPLLNYNVAGEQASRYPKPSSLSPLQHCTLPTSLRVGPHGLFLPILLYHSSSEFGELQTKQRGHGKEDLFALRPGVVVRANLNELSGNAT